MPRRRCKPSGSGSRRGITRTSLRCVPLFAVFDKVGERYVFNIGGNKYRLIAAIAFAPQLLWVKAVLTHTDYDEGDWK